MTTQEQQPKYIYGVVRTEHAKELEGTGIGDQPLDVVGLDAIGALTSDVAEGPLEAGRAELLAHAHALEVAFEHGTVLPMQFGVVMDDAETVRRELLASHRDELDAQLEELEGKVEINVRGLYDEPTILREIVESDRTVAKLKELVARGSEDATYPERIRLGELISEALAARREADGAMIVDRLAQQAVAVEVGEPMHERMAVSGSFLVDRARLEAFDAELDRIAEEQDGRIRFKYTGPLPPHSFVELSLES